MIEYTDNKSNMGEKGLILVCSSRGHAVCHGREGMGKAQEASLEVGSRETTLPLHTGSKDNRKWGQATKCQSLPPVVYFLQQDSTSQRFQNSPN